MPTSAWHYISPVLSEVARLHGERPLLSVLDVGCGAGKWGFLVRDLLDHYHHAVYHRTDWRTRIDGIEAFPAYRTPIHDHVYDHVYWANATEVVPSLGSYDIVIAMEVIEHLEKPMGISLLDALVARCRRSLFLSFPPEYDGTGHHVLEQGAVHQNQFESHRSIWSEADLADYPHRSISFQTFLLEGRSRAPGVEREQRIGDAPPTAGPLPLRYRLADTLNTGLRRVPLVHDALKTLGKRLVR